MVSAGYWPKTWSRCSMCRPTTTWRMDGYALRAMDLAAGRRQPPAVVGSARRGALLDPIGKGQAVRIMTGGVAARRGLRRRRSLRAEGAG